MEIKRVHIPEKIKQFRNKRISQELLLEQVKNILKEEELKEEKILEALKEDNEVEEENSFNLDLMEQDRIFHISDIERICIDYRLRFLNSGMFKSELPIEALLKIKYFEKEHNIELKGFKIMAPAKMFKLQNADDPLLFAPIANDYYYLIHSWGRDLHPLRKLMMWPFKTFENFILVLLAVSYLFTLMVPDGLFVEKASTSEFLMIYFFMFKWVAGLALFYGFKYGKSFSSGNWRSRFYNA